MNTPVNTDVSNLAWSEESLILFYYDELDADETLAIEKDLKQSRKLQQQYQFICELLGESISKEVPKPSVNLNQNIMAAVYRSAEHLEISQDESKSTSLKAQAPNLFRRVLDLLQPGFAFSLLAMLSVSLFFIGRWSAAPDLQRSMVEANSKVNLESNAFTLAQSQRVLYTSLNQHLDSSNRILTLVSNASDNGNDVAKQMKERSQFIKELISFNRIYRLIIEKSGDKQLAQTLSQIELVLVELNNSTYGKTVDSEPDSEDLKQIKHRLISSDLLFKLRVSHKDIQQTKI